jgi:Uma2 family endonuclease
VAGERLSQAEFHRRYEQCPQDEKWELVGGVVYMASPLRYPHGRHQPKLSTLFDLYEDETPGVEVVDNASVFLSGKSEPQPDLTLRIVAECGGQSVVNERQYLQGAPELLAEISHSSREFDLNLKRQDYEQAGVIEYLVLCVEEPEVFWFHFPSGEEIKPNRQGVSRSRVFPGLWIDTAALLRRDGPKARAVLAQGLASRAHARFVKRLEAERRRRSHP